MGTEKKTVISFVGKSYAKQDFTFYFQNIKSTCPPTCRLYNTCMKNLEPNTVYQVTDVKGKEMKCPHDLHEEDMILVELKIPNLEVSMKNRDIFLGSLVSYEPISCNEKDCPHRKYCVPTKYVIKPNQKVKVVKKLQRIEDCPIGLNLTVVKIRKRKD